MTILLTGERTVPGVAAENYWFRRHEVAYEYAVECVDGARVLEIGCGEGYGTALLSTTADSVIGIDYDAETVANAAFRYHAPKFVRGNLAALPVPDASVDVVVTLQVVEHVWDHPQFVRECIRVLRPGGVALMTTPNRLTFSPGVDEPVNPFHTKEFTADELTALLTSCGLEVDLVGGVHAGPRLHELDARYGSFVEAQLDTEPQDWSAELRMDVASVTSGDFEIVDNGDLDIDDALDLLVLASKPAT